ncbi:hypothetical protein AB0D42_15055 [Streptomyces sp. NPDC048304]|uniref:hypothetical protein n=1 Tax=Streptomyces sp. NPDC048304 TaxID=3154820 RepID=UPI0033DF1AAD
MGVQIASWAISGGDPVAFAAGAPSGGWAPWVGVLVASFAVVVAAAAFRAGRGDRHQDRATESLREFAEVVHDIEVEQHRLLGRVVAETDLKLLWDLQPKTELFPDRLPQPLQLCARQLESWLAKYLAVAGPAPTGCSAEEHARVEQRMYAGQGLRSAIAAAYKALDAYKKRRKG